MSWYAACMIQDLISTTMPLLLDGYAYAVPVEFLVSLQDGWIRGYDVWLHLIGLFGRIPIFRFPAFK